jgi:hypothetical protein
MTVNGVDIRNQSDKEWERLGPFVFLDVNEPASSLSATKYSLPVRAPSKHNTMLMGLVLETTGSASGQFRRIRTFDITARDEQLHHMILARHENEYHLPSERYDAETRMHTICIV